MINLGFESLIYGYDSSSGDEVMDYAKTAQLYDELYSAEFCCSHMIYAMENVEAIRRVVRWYGITQSLEYLFGENDIPSMESDNWFVRMWNAIVRYLKIFWDWIVSLFNSTKRIVQHLNDAKKNLDKITYPVTINGVADTGLLLKNTNNLDEQLKNLREKNRHDFEYERDRNFGKDYDNDREHDRNIFKPTSATFNSSSDLGKSIDAHAKIIPYFEEWIKITKELRSKFKEEIKDERKAGNSNVNATPMKSLINTIRLARMNFNLCCSSARALVHGINKAAKKGAKESK